MKKIIAAGLIAATLAAGTFAVNAADTNTFSSDRGYGHMMERSDSENFEEMDKFNEEDGFRGRNCHGRKDGHRMNRNGMNKKGMMKNGMMGRNRR